MQDPFYRERYLIMNAAMNEGYLYTIGFFAGSISIMFASPFVISYGSMAITSEAELLSLSSSGAFRVAMVASMEEAMVKFSLDVGTKTAFSGGDLQKSDVTSAAVGAFVPGKFWYASGFAAESAGLGTQALLSDKPITEAQVIGAGIKSFIVSPLGTATGNAMEAVTNKTAGAAVEAVHNNAQSAVIDRELNH